MSCLTRLGLGGPSGPPILTLLPGQGPLCPQWWRLLLGSPTHPHLLPHPRPSPPARPAVLPWFPRSCTVARAPPAPALKVSPGLWSPDQQGHCRATHAGPRQPPGVGLRVSTPGPRCPPPPSPSPPQLPAARPQPSGSWPPTPCCPPALPTWPPGHVLPKRTGPPVGPQPSPGSRAARTRKGGRVWGWLGPNPGPTAVLLAPRPKLPSHL